MAAVEGHDGIRCGWLLEHAGRQRTLRRAEPSSRVPGVPRERVARAGARFTSRPWKRVVRKERFLGSLLSPQTDSFRELPALKVGTFPAGILIFSPVWGFLPSRAFCSLT